MSVKIRLMRVGKRKQPTYRVVVADSRSPRDGRIIETIGHYGPRSEPSKIDINGDRALDWLRQGAQPSESVQKLLTISGVWATFEAEKEGPIVTKLNRRGFSTGRGVTTKTKKKPTPDAAPAPAADAPAAVEAPVAEAPVAEATASEDATPEDGGE
ncbi:MAG: 30S ribosomal protein S16 [Acidimicrobiia bacterium]|nr:30S ribosomal protein S16 [Acidimicrobiia bacterium]